MGQRGPRPTPSAILKARGSWRGDATKGEPQPEAALPEPPGWLTADARAVWQQVIEQLARMKVVTRADANALARYADAFVRWRKAADFLEQKGDIYTIKGEDGTVKCVMPFPQVSIYNKLAATLLKLEQEFGLTPSARSRIQVPIAPDASSDANAQDQGPSKKRFFPQGPALRSG
jgi:P27 family predicted phage terminase small subunit